MKIFLLLMAVGLGLLGVKEFRLTQMAQDAPQALTCAELGANGPGDNVHVTMSDYGLVMDSFVVASKRDKWQEAWVPAVPLGGAYHQAALKAIAEHGEDYVMAPPEDLRVLIKLNDVHNEDDIEAVGKLSQLTGLVINEVDKLSSKAREILEQSYPGIDFKMCWILEVDRKPKGLGIVLLMLGGALAIILFVIRSWLKRKGDSTDTDSSIEPGTSPTN